MRFYHRRGRTRQCPRLDSNQRPSD